MFLIHMQKHLQLLRLISSLTFKGTGTMFRNKTLNKCENAFVHVLALTYRRPTG